jgi:hypothetical protein
LLKRICGVLAMALTCGHTAAQTLCGVVSLGRAVSDQPQFNFSFDGKKDVKVSSLHEKGETDFDLKAGLLSSNGKRLTSIPAAVGTNFYAVQGTDQSCVIRIEERDGVLGLYIEEHISTPGKPPQLRTEFVEVR